MNVRLNIRLHFLGSLSSKVNSLGPLPGLGTQSPNKDCDEDDGPFPANTGMQEDDMVKTGDVEGGKYDKEDAADGVEQELVSPEVSSPYFDALGHVKEGAAEIDEFPREEQEDPRHGGVAGSSGAEDGLARIAVLVVTVYTQVAVAKAEYHNGEGAQDAAGHEDAVDNHICEEFGGEDAVFKLSDVSVIHREA